MSANASHILKDALKLPLKERADLTDRLLSSLDHPDNYIDDLWRKEAENRVNAYRKGKIGSVSLNEVLSKYSKY